MNRRAARREKRDEIKGRPVRTVDGRDMNPSSGQLGGEAASMKVRKPDRGWPLHVEPKEAEAATYYGLPMLKEPVWRAWIPTYFFTGGAAGAAFALGAAAQLSRGRSMRDLTRRARWLGLAGVAVSAPLLIVDLGRPLRFLNMLRVFRPSSPMNLGTWVLSASGAFGAAAALFGGTRVGEASGLAAGIAGLPLSAYTAVLIANTAVPIWARARVTLPVLFTASAAASAASVLELSSMPARAQRATATFGRAGKVVESLAAIALEREVGKASVVGAPLRRGPTARLWKAARALTAGSLAIDLLAGGRRSWRVAGAALGAAGALAIRFAIARAGKESARDPNASFGTQRRELAEASR